MRICEEIQLSKRSDTARHKMYYTLIYTNLREKFLEADLVKREFQQNDIDITIMFAFAIP